MKSDKRIIERREYETAMRYLADIIKIDTSLMNKKDHENMQIHIDNILKLNSNKNLYENIIQYANDERENLKQTFSYLQEVELIKKENNKTVSKLKDKEIENTFLKFLEFQPEQVRRNEKIRKKYLNEMMRKLWITNMVISDFQEVCHYLKSNIAYPESFNALAKKINEKQYRVSRKLYGFDVYLNHSNLTVKNFTIMNDAVRERARSL